MKSMKWEEYLNISVATDEDIQQIERQLKIKFPEEFKQLLKLAQGKFPSPRFVESKEVCQVPFGSIFHVLQDVKPAFSIKCIKDIWDEYYPYLLPIADAGSACFFAYDLRKGAENPPIVFINAEADPEDEDQSENILFVASSLNELLSNLRDHD